MKDFVWITPALLAISMAGCNSSKSNHSASVAGAALNAVATKSADSEPSSISNPVTLKQDLIAIFGSEDGDPVQLKKGESLSDLLGRITP